MRTFQRVVMPCTRKSDAVVPQQIPWVYTGFGSPSTTLKNVKNSVRGGKVYVGRAFAVESPRLSNRQCETVKQLHKSVEKLYGGLFAPLRMSCIAR
jgi:hypothetical protein